MSRLSSSHLGSQEYTWILTRTHMRPTYPGDLGNTVWMMAALQPRLDIASSDTGEHARKQSPPYRHTPSAEHTPGLSFFRVSVNIPLKAGVFAALTADVKKKLEEERPPATGVLSAISLTIDWTIARSFSPNSMQETTTESKRRQNERKNHTR